MYSTGVDSSVPSPSTDDVQQHNTDSPTCSLISFMLPWQPFTSPPQFSKEMEQVYKAHVTASKLAHPAEMSNDPRLEEHPKNIQSYGSEDTPPEMVRPDLSDIHQHTPQSAVQESYDIATESSGEPNAGLSAQPSRPESVNSFHSSVDSYLFRDAHGRRFNTLIESYPLPADMPEHERLSIQHRIITYLLGNLYPAADIVEEILARNDRHTPMILDIGTGSGAWVMEMAAKFPNAEIIGMDLAPPHLGNLTVPENCRFEVDDANLSLGHWANTFDLVHVRAAGGGIHDHQAFLHNVAQVLRPGGLLIVGNGNPQFVDDHAEPCRTLEEGQKGFRWVQKLFTAVAGAFYNKSGTKWASDYHLATLANSMFKDVTSQVMLMPIGNWFSATATQEHQYAAELNRHNFILMADAFIPLLISDGYREEVVDHWRTEVKKELLELKDRTCATFTWTWSRRTDDTWMPMAGALNNGVQ